MLCYLDYVEDIYQTLLEAMNTTNCLGSAVRELKEMTPVPMNTMLDKETRESALDSRQKRKKWYLKMSLQLHHVSTPGFICIREKLKCN